jgi:hypothetical protein
MIPLGYEEFVSLLVKTAPLAWDWLIGVWVPDIEFMPRRPKFLFVEKQEEELWGIGRGVGGWEEDGTPAPPVDTWEQVASDLTLPEVYNLLLKEMERLKTDRAGSMSWYD